MHDFFTGAFGQPSSSTTATPADQAFVDAVVSRFGVPPLLTARLPDSPKGSGPSIPAFSFPSRPAPPLSAPSKPPVPSSPAAPAPAASFTPVRVAELPDRLADPRTLILDIRPHAAYTNGRLPRALSLSVPSTLLKRPLFNIARVGEMLPALVRRKLERWRESDFILVYDADTNTLGASSNVKGLLAKFHAEGVDPARLGWIQGGFQSVWRERRDFVDQDPPSDDESDSDPPSDPTSPQHALPPTLSQPAAAAPSLRARDLPMAAFFKSSTTSQLMTSAGPRGMTPNPQAFNPFFDTIRQNVELSHGITERIPLRLPASIRRRIDDLPFEWLRDIARRADDMSRSDQDGDLDDEDPTELVGYTDSFPIRAGGQSADDRTGPILLPDADARKQPKANDVDEGAESLAMQFYKIELAEQRRLTGVMQHHSKESVAGGGGGGGAASEPAVVQSGTLEPPAPPPKREFPFSITAGVEKGAKNRYRNIWPFEHARVRLRKRRLSDDDYINASFVQPLGTTKRYIATQGPLPATFADFWTLCWEQNVHVIVMLTREIEGSMVKCGNYWTEGVYGRLRLRHIETVGTPSVSDAAHQAANQHSGGFEFFGPRATSSDHGRSPISGAGHSPGAPPARGSSTVKRVFELSHMDYPAVPPRVVTQMQYLDWPDMNVPSDPRTLLAFVKEVDRVEKAGTRWPWEQPYLRQQYQHQHQHQQHDKVRLARRDGEGAGPGSGSGDEERFGRKENIDPQTGIARHAYGRRPVLLHCSAGVGRTGGYIVIDAVLDGIRREMKKRMEAGQEARQTSDEEKEAMDVDEAEVGSQPKQQQQQQQVDDVVELGARELARETAKLEEPMEVDGGASGEAGAGAGLGGQNVPMGPPKLLQARVQPASVETHQAQGGAQAGTGTIGEKHEARAPAGVDAPQARPGPAPVQLSQTQPQSSVTTIPATSTGDVLDMIPVPGSLASAPEPASPSRTTFQPRTRTWSVNDARRIPMRSWISATAAATDSPAAPPQPIVWTPGPLPTPAENASPTPEPSTSTSNSRESSIGAPSSKSQGMPFPGTPSSAHTRDSTDTASGSTPSPVADARVRTVSSPSPSISPSPSPLLLDVRKKTMSPSPLRTNATSPQAVGPSVASESDATRSSSSNPSSLFSNKSGKDSRTTVLSSLGGSRSGSQSGDEQEKKKAEEDDDDSNDGNNKKSKMTFDYLQPRQLHEDGSPPLLSTYVEPVRELVEDIREQRMSLCQSLRQYVFVHQAIIEGALQIVDEFRAGGGEDPSSSSSGVAADKAVVAHSPPLFTPLALSVPPSPSKGKRKHSPTENGSGLKRRSSVKHPLTVTNA